MCVKDVDMCGFRVFDRSRLRVRELSPPPPAPGAPRAAGAARRRGRENTDHSVLTSSLSKDSKERSEVSNR